MDVCTLGCWTYEPLVCSSVVKSHLTHRTVCCSAGHHFKGEFIEYMSFAKMISLGWLHTVVTVILLVLNIQRIWLEATMLK